MADNFGTIPGANTGGTNMAVPTTGSNSTAPAVGGQTNPFLPAPVSGAQTPGLMNTTSNASPTAPGDLGGLNPFNTLGGSTSWVKQNDFIKAMRKSGFSAGDAGLLYSFLQSGAGFNPQVAQALINANKPGIERGQANILEQFSSQGLRGGSPAAVAMGDFMSQVDLNEQQIFAQLYEQSVQNYLSVLMGGKGKPPASTMENILMGTEAIKNLSQAASAGASAADH
jgi:hypothetical protein